MSKTLPEQIDATAARLAQLHARQRLAEQVERARARKLEKRQQAKTLAGLLRSSDAHRKIEVGGIVIAAGADDFDAAELCGWLLAVVTQRAAKPDAAIAMRERGLQHFAARDAARGSSRPRRQP
jgi:hypothetical protein